MEHPDRDIREGYGGDDEILDPPPDVGDVLVEGEE